MHGNEAQLYVCDHRLFLYLQMYVKELSVLTAFNNAFGTHLKPLTKAYTTFSLIS